MTDKSLPSRDAGGCGTQLTAEQICILHEHGTERAFTGPHLQEKRKGIYSCVGCANPLFGSDTKYESGSGWPSFFHPVSPESVTEHPDTSYGMRRVEIRCGRCDGHLGHVFPDGPRPTGLRYCMNGTVLHFTPDDSA